MSQLSLDEIKRQAKALRRSLENDGQSITHSKSLEIVAEQHGFRDWNTMHAATGNQPPIPFYVGQHVSGDYLGQPFLGEIISLSSIGGNARFAMTLRFDEAVDVITFEGMSNFRKQVNATVDRTGRTHEKTSNGLPQLVLDQH